MQQRDYLKDQIDQMAKVLATLLANFLGLKSSGNATQAVSVATEQFTELLHWNPDQLLSMSSEELQSFVASNGLQEEHVALIGRYYKEVGAALWNEDEPKATQYFSTGRNIISAFEQTSQTTSLSLTLLAGELEQLLKSDT